MVEEERRTSAASIRVLLVDALNLIRRVYAAQPGEDGAERAEEARVACRQSLLRAMREVQPTHAVVVFEGQGPTWRHERFPGYKAGHKPMPEALRRELTGFRESFARQGAQSLEVPGVEADDVIGTLAAKLEAAGASSVILSTDKIFLQLLSEQIAVRDHFRKAYLDRRYTLDRFGVPPDFLVDLLALAGDSTNAIPGVPGVGVKTAAKLLVEFGSLEALLAAAADEAPEATGSGSAMKPSVRKKIAEGVEAARLAQSLVRLDIDLDLGFSLKAFRREA